MKAGDLVRIYAPIAGYNKYHFCICIPDDNNSGKFLFLNSDPNYKDCLPVACSRVPQIPPSDTGVTAISFSLLARYNSEKLDLYKAEVLGEMPLDVIADMRDFLATVRSLPKPDKLFIKAVLDSLLGS